MRSKPLPPADASALIRRTFGLCRMMRHWPDPVLDELVAASRLGRYDRHEQILADNPLRREVLVVASGCVAVDSVDASGARFLLAVHGPGDLTGLMRLLDETEFVYNFHAHEPSVLAHVPAEALQAVLDAHPPLWKDVCLLMLSRAHDQIVARRELTLGRLDRQVAGVVLQLAQVHGQQSSGDGGSALFVRVSQSDLAAMLSVSRQTVNKEIRQLEQRGLLQAEYGRLEIRNLPELARIAQGEC